MCVCIRVAPLDHFLFCFDFSFFFSFSLSLPLRRRGTLAYKRISNEKWGRVCIKSTCHCKSKVNALTGQIDDRRPDGYQEKQEKTKQKSRVRHFLPRRNGLVREQPRRRYTYVRPGKKKIKAEKNPKN